MFWLPIVIYVPALAFNQVTGVNVHLITPIVCIVCIFYTCVVSSLKHSTYFLILNKNNNNFNRVALKQLFGPTLFKQL